MLFRSRIPMLGLLAVIACKRSPEGQVEVRDSTTFYYEWAPLTAHLLQRMNLEPGERVLLVARPGKFEPMVPLLKEWIEAANGVYLGTMSVDSVAVPEGWHTAFTRAAEGNSYPALAERFKTVDIAVMMPGTTVSDNAYGAMQEVLRGGHGRTIHFHWAGAYSLSGSLLEMTRDIDRYYQTAILSTDYRRLSELQQYFEEAARKSGIHVTTPGGTDITFSIGDRPVTKQDGDASRGRTHYARNLIDREIEIPAGAIRVAPVEESVSGKIAFPDADWGHTRVTDLVLTLEAGKVVGMTAASGLSAVKAELDSAGTTGYSFREFALGFNPLLAVPSAGLPWIPYYGYGAGVVRLSLGDNTELGGNVGGGYVRWNFFIDATVKVGEMVLVKDGKMLH